MTNNYIKENMLDLVKKNFTTSDPKPLQSLLVQHPLLTPSSLLGLLPLAICKASSVRLTLYYCHFSCTFFFLVSFFHF